MTDLSRITPANLSVTTDHNGTCVTADASKPAPEFASLLKALANPVKPEPAPLDPGSLKSFGTEKAKQMIARAYGVRIDPDGTARIEL